MPDLLLELLSEEIPARMQARAAEDLKKLVTDALVAEGLLYEGAVAFATPRRLALHVAGLPAKGRDQREERRGPRVGAPEEALKGFLRNAGVASAEQVSVVSDPKKGDFYQVTIEKPGRLTPQVLSELLPGIVRSFPWPKSMRWGAASREPGSLRWVRPLQSILCTFGSDQETPEIVPLLVDGLISGDTSRGHRFMAPEGFRARRFDDYVAALDAAKVVLDAGRRRDIIRHDARDLAFAQGLEVIEDEALLDEVAGLVEWPVVLMGSFDEAYLDIPPEVIRATIRANQKCFVLRRPLSPWNGERSSAPAGAPGEGHPSAEHGASAAPHPVALPGGSTSPRSRGEEGGALANRFLLVANIEASDGGAAIVHGNERVVRARLADAKFFWDTDRRTKLEERLPRLGSIVFHEKLGTQGERVERLISLTRFIVEQIESTKSYSERDSRFYNLSIHAASLCKLDLVTDMVGEFPELQGLMGRYYALAEGLDPRVANALEDHYRPLGPTDRVPTEPVTIAIALADKLDTLVGFWAIGEKPTGSKDPFALRRAALGVIRLVLENGLRLPIVKLCNMAGKIQSDQLLGNCAAGYQDDLEGEEVLVRYSDVLDQSSDRKIETTSFTQIIHEDGCILIDPIRGERRWRNDVKIGERLGSFEYLPSLLSFFHDRLKVYLRERGARHDLIDAVLAAGGSAPASPLAGEVAAQPPEGGRPAASAEVEPGGTPPTPGPSPRGGGEGARNDDLLMVVRRVEALGAFLATEDGRNLLAATKRAANILRIEEKKDGRSYDDLPVPGDLVEPEEKSLAMALAVATGAAEKAVAQEDFDAAMRALADSRPAIDAFFDKVTVNASEPHLRENRLKLLSMLRRATREVADFSRIEG